MIAKSIVDTLTMEAMVNMRVAYGTIVNQLRDVSKSYKEAGMALDVGRIFYEQKNVLAYNELGIGRRFISSRYLCVTCFYRKCLTEKRWISSMRRL